MKCQMAMRDLFKISWKTFVDPRAWVNYDALLQYNRTLYLILSGLFQKPQKPAKGKNFQTVMRREGLTDDALASLAVNYQTYAYLFFVLGLAVLLFAFYLMWAHWSFSGLLLAVSAAALFFSQWFRYSFWHFQITQRNLNCTVQDWWRGKRLNKGSK